MTGGPCRSTKPDPRRCGSCAGRAAHPLWSYQLAFQPAEFALVLAWLVLKHGALDVFVHPNTGDAWRDHRDAALWIGHSHGLHLEALAA
jgi:DOPA 4,5-dioxygenase